MKRSVAILGCAGYSGQETLDRVLAHPELTVLALGSDSLAGRGASALDPRLNGSLPSFVSNDEAAASGADVLFLCLDNEAAAAFEPPSDTLVVDLSGAHRLVDDELARGWYGTAPGAWSYGLPEIFPAEGLLIANPGCYATAALLALAPLAQVANGPIVVDGKSGVSGAGRTLKQSSHAGSVLENVSPYAVGEHRHAPEIGVFADGATGTAIVICAIDNLGKGAAGNAVQNANVALGLEETAGLRLAGVLV